MPILAVVLLNLQIDGADTVHCCDREQREPGPSEFRHQVQRKARADQQERPL